MATDLWLPTTALSPTLAVDVPVGSLAIAALDPSASLPWLGIRIEEPNRISFMSLQTKYDKLNCVVEDFSNEQRRLLVFGKDFAIDVSGSSNAQSFAHPSPPQGAMLSWCGGTGIVCSHKPYQGFVPSSVIININSWTIDERVVPDMVFSKWRLRLTLSSAEFTTWECEADSV